ncbi:hypothetical protein EUX98_g8544 [Antrodiella citrinella]|uniref:Uncharacterized protein n=1 Tax=Antrodiella citrinella TaxID=2447956 RepID=A0A4S4M609_9APHY|nr:hypothetical protein EUX98_g8544 [Antrodiella citrinella]
MARRKTPLTAEEEAARLEDQRAKGRERTRRSREKKKEIQQAEQAKKLTDIATMELEKRMQVEQQISAALAPAPAPASTLNTAGRVTRSEAKVSEQQPRPSRDDGPATVKKASSKAKRVAQGKAEANTHAADADADANPKANPDVSADADDAANDTDVDTETDVQQGHRMGLTRQESVWNVMHPQDAHDARAGRHEPNFPVGRYEPNFPQPSPHMSAPTNEPGALAGTSTPKNRRVVLDLTSTSTVKPHRKRSSLSATKRKGRKSSMSPKQKRMPASVLQSILKKSAQKPTPGPAPAVAEDAQMRELEEGDKSDLTVSDLSEGKGLEIDPSSSATEDGESHSDATTENPFTNGSTSRVLTIQDNDTELEDESDAVNTPSVRRVPTSSVPISSSNPVLVPRREDPALVLQDGNTKRKRDDGTDQISQLPSKKRSTDNNQTSEMAGAAASDRIAAPNAKQLVPQTPGPKTKTKKGKSQPKPGLQEQLREARGQIRAKQLPILPTVAAAPSESGPSTQANENAALRANQQDDVYEMTQDPAAEAAEARNSPKGPVTKKSGTIEELGELYGVTAVATPMRPLKTRALADSARKSAAMLKAEPPSKSEEGSTAVKLEDTHPQAKSKSNVKILRKFASLPVNIRDDPTDSWKSIFLPTLSAIVGITPDPFFIPDVILLRILGALAAKIYPNIALDIVKESAIFHNASQRVSEYRTAFGTAAVTLVWRELFHNELHTLDERAIYAKMMLADDRFLYGDAEGNDPQGWKDVYGNELIMKTLVCHFSSSSGATEMPPSLISIFEDSYSPMARIKLKEGRVTVAALRGALTLAIVAVERAWTLWATGQMVLEKAQTIGDKYFTDVPPSVVKPEKNPAQNQFSKDKYGAILCTRWLEDILEISDRKIAKICSKSQDLYLSKKRTAQAPGLGKVKSEAQDEMWGLQKSVIRRSKPQRCRDSDSE